MKKIIRTILILLTLVSLTGCTVGGLFYTDYNKVSVEGEEYSLTITVGELMAKGWVPANGYTTETELSFGKDCIFEKDGQLITVTVLNPYDGSIKFGEAFVQKIVFDMEHCPNLSVRMDEDITLGFATEEDVKKALGTPSNTLKTSDAVTFVYETGQNRAEFTFTENPASGTYALTSLSVEGGGNY